MGQATGIRLDSILGPSGDPRAKYKQRLDRISNLSAGQAVVTMSPLALDAEKLAVHEPGKVSTGRLRCNVCNAGQFARRKRNAAHQAEQDCSPCRVSQQIRGR